MALKPILTLKKGVQGVNIKQTLTFDEWVAVYAAEIQEIGDECGKMIPADPSKMREFDRKLSAYVSRVGELLVDAEGFFRDKKAKESATIIKDNPELKVRTVDALAENASRDEGRVYRILVQLQKSLSEQLKTLKTQISYCKEELRNFGNSDNVEGGKKV